MSAKRAPPTEWQQLILRWLGKHPVISTSGVYRGANFSRLPVWSLDENQRYPVVDLLGPGALLQDFSHARVHVMDSEAVMQQRRWHAWGVLVSQGPMFTPDPNRAIRDDRFLMLHKHRLLVPQSADVIERYIEAHLSRPRLLKIDGERSILAAEAAASILVYYRNLKERLSVVS